MKRAEHGLTAWQLTTMALGSVIGGSFFLGSAVAIHATGPSVVIAFALGGVLSYFILQALSEMTVANPYSGSFRSFAAKAFGTGSGFVVGWVYWTGMVLAMSSEATAVSILLRNWIPNLSIWLLGSAVIVCVTLINLLGAKQLSRLESLLALIKVTSIVFFIVLALTLITGIFTNQPAIGLGVLTQEPFFAGGWKSLAGSMLIVMFTYAGFEVIGLAAAEVDTPKKNFPKAIRSTVFSLVGLYMLANVVLLPLIPTAQISEAVSPFVAALNIHGFNWAGTAVTVVLITAILSTMLAAMFAVGRMMSSLAEDGLSPSWIKDKHGVPYRGILFSGLSMLFSLWFGMFLPSVYLFLISAGGFSILFCYIMIMASHIRFRSNSPGTQAKIPYTSVFTLFALIGVILSMPFVEGQLTGLIAGGIILSVYSISYLAIRVYHRKDRSMLWTVMKEQRLQPEFSEEFLEPLSEQQEEP